MSDIPTNSAPGSIYFLTLQIFVMQAVKLVITSKNNLRTKYGTGLTSIDKELRNLVKTDKGRDLKTRIVYIDEPASAKAAGIKTVKSITARSCKQAVDELYKKHLPAYMVILGSQDIIPFQEIRNPAQDEDDIVPSDLPYACDTGYGTDIGAFTGPTRVIGRLPDIPGSNDPTYMVRLIKNVSKHSPVKAQNYQEYFSVSAKVWRKSTELSLQNIFGHNGRLLLSPPGSGRYKKGQLKALTHFINCHGAPNDYRFYGQEKEDYPEAMWSDDLEKKIAPGTVVAAECCYGADLVDPTQTDELRKDGMPAVSIANTYLANNAMAFVGSTTIAYGPPDGQGLADLITQYFLKCVHRGASTGRALLEARQKFLSVCAPHLDPYELKTLAQFHLLGDPSVQLVKEEDIETGALSKSTRENNRIRLFNKGVELKNSITPSKKIRTTGRTAKPKELKTLLKETAFEGTEEVVYQVKPKKSNARGLEKKLIGQNARFRTFIKFRQKSRINDYQILVVKENEQQLLGWRLYVSK